MARPKTKLFKQVICRYLGLGVPIQIILDGKKVLKEGEEILMHDDISQYRRMQGWPDWETVIHWLGEDNVFKVDYDEARVYGADYLADDMLGLIQMLKEDPKKAPAVKAAMEILKWQTMVRNSKYSERIIQETKNSAPADPHKVAQEIDRLERELRIVKK